MTPPSAIAHYRIISKLGQGGMGAVYCATDTKLNRDVAIKVLPEAYAQDADRMARFAREAQVLARLNHPNIAAIYGLEERSLVLELVPGPDLSERIATGLASASPNSAAAEFRSSSSARTAASPNMPSTVGASGCARRSRCASLWWIGMDRHPRRSGADSR